jgi:nucleoid-associated protein YgaU
MIRTHTVVGDDTLSAIVQSFYGDALRFWVIAAANGKSSP